MLDITYKIYCFEIILHFSTKNRDTVQINAKQFFMFGYFIFMFYCSICVLKKLWYLLHSTKFNYILKAELKCSEDRIYMKHIAAFELLVQFLSTELFDAWLKWLPVAMELLQGNFRMPYVTAWCHSQDVKQT